MSTHTTINITDDGARKGWYHIKLNEQSGATTRLYLSRATIEALQHAIESQLQSEAEIVRTADNRTTIMEDAVRVLNAPDRETVTL